MYIYIWQEELGFCGSDSFAMKLVLYLLHRGIFLLVCFFFFLQARLFFPRHLTRKLIYQCERCFWDETPAKKQNPGFISFFEVAHVILDATVFELQNASNYYYYYYYRLLVSYSKNVDRK